MKDDNCVFCKILAGDIPSRVVYEDEAFKAIMDVGPATVGHCLLLPKSHCANIYEMPDDTAEKLLPVAKKIATNLKEKLGCDGLNLVQNNGEEAGQTVFHFHMHLIPRYKGGRKTDVSWGHEELTDAQFDEILEKIKM